MTKEQALEILRQPDRIGCHMIKANDEESCKYNQESIEALDMAIKALEQQPSEDCVLRWIERFNDEDKWLECPHCHKDSDNAYAYCPNCGASFKEEKRGSKDD
ncbi:hypothetical protein [Pseudobutyrivibrio sp.]